MVFTAFSEDDEHYINYYYIIIILGTHAIYHLQYIILMHRFGYDFSSCKSIIFGLDQHIPFN